MSIQINHLTQKYDINLKSHLKKLSFVLPNNLKFVFYSKEIPSKSIHINCGKNLALN